MKGNIICLEERECLIFFVFDIVTVDGIKTDFFVVLFEGGHVLACLGELAFFHAFADIPVNKCSLGVHQIELVVKSSPGLSDGRGVG